MSDVPPIDKEPTSLRLNELEERLAAIEADSTLEGLDLENQTRALLAKEIRQRILLRWLSVTLAVIVIVFMALALWHITHRVFWGPFVFVSPSIAVAMFVAPVVSITTITVMIAIGAFRKFKDEDMSGINLSSIAGDSARSFLGGGSQQ